MPAVSWVATLARVAEILGEDIELLHEITIDMEPEDGLIAIYGTGDDYTPGLTDAGIDNIQELIPMYRERRGQTGAS